MKTIFLFFLSLCLCKITAAQKSSTQVSISGQLKNFSNQVEVEDLSEMQYLLFPTGSGRMIIPDSAGNFKIQFKLINPNYFRMGRNILYLTPGDDLIVFIDMENPGNATFKGKGNSANFYLRNTPFPKSGSFLEGGRNILKEQKETIDTILNLANIRSAELKQLKDVTSEFKRLERARIKADVINSFESVSFYGPYMLKLKGDRAKELVEQYRILSKPIADKYSKNFIDPSFMKLVVYRDISPDLIKQGGNEEGKQLINDWLTASDLIRKMNEVNGKEGLFEYSEKIGVIKTLKYKDALNNYKSHLLAFGKGDPAVDFNAKDIDGNSISLSSLKGKIIYVDLWATWCGPCLEEMPYYDKLKEKYKNNSEIAFVSLSIDDGVSLWKRNVQARNAGGVQWVIDRSKLSAYNIVAIPRTLIIGKDFKMIDMNAPVPSSKETEKIINTLLQQKI